MRNYIYIFTIFLLFSCEKEKYKLEWKIKSAKPVYYKLVMKPAKEPKLKIGFNESESGNEEKGKNIVKELLKGSENLEQCIVLNRIDADNIDFILVNYIPKLKENSSDYGLGDMFSSFAQGVRIKAKVNNKGQMYRNSLEFSQKNLISLLCQLPNSPVSIGDSWALNINYNKEMFKWASEQVNETNEVKLVDIKLWNNSYVAILEYEINIFAECKMGSMFSEDKYNYISSISFEGRSEFDILRGKWRKLEGILSKKETGFVSVEESQYIKLTRIKSLPPRALNILKGTTNKKDMETYNKLVSEIEAKKKVKTKSVEADQLKHNKNNNTIVESLIKKDVNCPVIYTVQLLASKERIRLDGKRFSKIKEDVYEVLKSDEAYKYKYRVGKECTLKVAQQIKKRLESLGFQGAFITKEISE